MNPFPSFFCLALTAILAASALAADAGKSSALTSALQPYVDRRTLAGAVALVGDRDHTLALEAVGYSDVSERKALKTDALFWIASQSKAITCAALMMLVDEGKVGLDDPVSKYVPEFHDLWVAQERDGAHVLLRRPKGEPTIRQLMSHTAGLPFSSRMESPTLDVLSLKDGAKSYAVTPLDSDPGTRYAYSNAGINTAGRIIEIVSGMPYEHFLQTRLFDPLGMKDTTFWPNAKQLARLAHSYKPNSAKTDLEELPVTQLRYPLSDHTRYPMPAGGLFSTAEDIGRFCRLLLNGGTYEGKRLLSEKAVGEMTRKQTGDHVTENYGFGLSLGDGWFGHGGAYATNMRVDTKRGLIEVYLVQHAGFPGDGGQAQGAFIRAAESAFGH